MPKITVTADPVSSQSNDAPILLSESVRSVHISTDHAAAQLIERLAWAISDAEDAEGADGWDFRRLKPPTQSQPESQKTRRGSASRSRERQAVNA